VTGSLDFLYLFATLIVSFSAYSYVKLVWFHGHPKEDVCRTVEELKVARSVSPLLGPS
jgi:hypothetical protein